MTADDALHIAQYVVTGGGLVVVWRAFVLAMRFGAMMQQLESERDEARLWRDKKGKEISTFMSKVQWMRDDILKHVDDKYVLRALAEEWVKTASHERDMILEMIDRHPGSRTRLGDRRP